MILSFKTLGPAGTPTDFVLRIWDGLILNKLATQEEKETWTRGLISVYAEYAALGDASREACAKIHTIRADSHNRWKAGMPIHFVINNRTPQRKQFAPVIFCVSTQKIRIEKELIDPNLPSKSKTWNIKKFHLYIDGKPYINPSPRHGYDEDAVEYLANNDGFMFDWQFMNWWPEGTFEGKIIHWTNFTYNANH